MRNQTLKELNKKGNVVIKTSNRMHKMVDKLQQPKRKRKTYKKNGLIYLKLEKKIPVMRIWLALMVVVMLIGLIALSR